MGRGYHRNFVLIICSYEYWYRVFWFLFITYICNLNWNLGLQVWSQWNIKKFTNNRFNNIQLNETAPPKVSEKTYSIVKQDFSNKNIDDENLFIFENSLSFETTDFQNCKFKKIYIISNKNKNRSIKLSEKVVKFKSLLIEDQEQRLKAKSIDCEVIDISEIKKIENCYSLYPTVGENLDYLNSNNIKIDFLY